MSRCLRQMHGYSTQEQLVIEFNPFKRAQSEILGDGHRLEATGRGVVDVQLILPNGQTKKKQICDVLYVPGFSYNNCSNLISIALSER